MMDITKIIDRWDEAEKYSQGLPKEDRSIARTVGFYDCLCRKESGVNILKRIMRFRRGEGKYNFSRGLSDQEREIASMEAWEEIENEILNYLAQ